MKASRLSEETRELRDGEEEVVRGKRHRKRENKAKILQEWSVLWQLNYPKTLYYLLQTRTENRAPYNTPVIYMCFPNQVSTFLNKEIKYIFVFSLRYPERTL